MPDARLLQRLRAMVDDEFDGKSPELVATLRHEFSNAFDSLESLLAIGAVDTFADVMTLAKAKLHETQIQARVRSRRLKIGLFPSTLNPIHWGHLLIGLQCVARLQLDMMVFLVHGEIKHKVFPKNSPPDWQRHQLAKEALEHWNPLFRYSDVALSNSKKGEESLHDFRRLNASHELDLYCIWGAETKDRLRSIIEALVAHDSPSDIKDVPHRLILSVVTRDKSERDSDIPTALECRKIAMDKGLSWDMEILELDTLPVSSTEYRDTGNPALVPRSVHEFVTREGLYGLGPARTISE